MGDSYTTQYDVDQPYLRVLEGYDVLENAVMYT